MIELIAGGARSGKSGYALRSAEAISGQYLFVATATSDDVGMAERIARHKAERGDHWRLIEEPLSLSSVLKKTKQGQIVLVDCLTLWVTNWLCSEDPSGWPAEKKNFLSELETNKADIFLVTNEVGMGVIPMGQLTRDFVDQTGWLHQEVAVIADAVTMVTFGIPVAIKSA